MNQIQNQNQLETTPVFSTALEENINRYNELETSNYYSLFQYNDLNIRYYHNEWIQTQESINIVNSILYFMNDTEVTPLLGDSTRTNNDTNTIELIKEKSEKATYADMKHSIINDQCPILLLPFENDSIVYFFKNCCHALDASVFEQFVQTFQKCPLCNDSLI